MTMNEKRTTRTDDDDLDLIPEQLKDLTLPANAAEGIRGGDTTGGAVCYCGTG
jgi:hypothetical protein